MNPPYPESYCKHIILVREQEPKPRDWIYDKLTLLHIRSIFGTPAWTGNLSAVWPVTVGRDICPQVNYADSVIGHWVCIPWIAWDVWRIRSISFCQNITMISWIKMSMTMLMLQMTVLNKSFIKHFLFSKELSLRLVIFFITSWVYPLEEPY